MPIFLIAYATRMKATETCSTGHSCFGAQHIHMPHTARRTNPIQLAGGNKLGFKHGNLHAFEGEKKVPLANLFVSMLNGVDVPVTSFADSTGPMTDLRG